MGAVTAKGEHDADAVVMNADFAQAMTRLVPDALRRRWTDRRLAALGFEPRDKPQNPETFEVIRACSRHASQSPAPFFGVGRFLFGSDSWEVA